MSENCVLGYNNRIDAATTTIVAAGGSWLDALPLTNLQDRTLGVVARSGSALLSATKFRVDVGDGKNTRCLGVLNHNLSEDGKYRIRASDDNTFATTDYDSGWVDAWPAVYIPEESDFELDNWFGGQYSDEEKAGLMPNILIVLPTVLFSRYWLVEFDDTLNDNGFVQLARFFIGEGWQTSINPRFGNSLGWEDPSEIEEAISGAESADERTKFRVVNFTIDYLRIDETYSQAYEVMRKAGTTKEILFFTDPTDTVHAIRRSFPARLRTLSAIENPNVDAYGTAWQAKELIT